MPGKSTNPWQQLSGNDQFFWLLAGNTALYFGFFATMLLRSLLAWDLTQDQMSLAYINLLTALCMFAVSLFSGLVIDRTERRQLVIAAQLVIFVAEASILLLILVDKLTFEYLLLGAMASSMAFPFIMPTRTAMLVDAVGKPPLGKATAVLTAGINIARMISPAAVGLLADAGGFVPAYIFLVGLHLVSLACTTRLKKYPASDESHDGIITELARSYSYIFRHRSLGMAILFGILPMLLVVPLQNMMVVIVEDLWNAGSRGLGIMMAAMGIGGLLGSLLMALLREGNLVRPLVGGTLCMALLLLMFCQVSKLWLAMLLVAGISSCSVLAQTIINTAVQLMSEDFIRGRITTITLLSFSLTPVATVPMAHAMKTLGTQQALSMAALLLIVAVMLIWWLSPSLRKIDEFSKF